MSVFYYYPGGIEASIVLPSPTWITDVEKIKNIKLRKSMSGKVRTYVMRDRRTTNAQKFSLHFEHLHRAKMIELQRFLLNADGHYLWFHGVESSVSAKIAKNAGVGSTTLSLKDVTGTIYKGDYVQIDGYTYAITATGITIRPSLQSSAYIDDVVTILKKQLVLVTNSEISAASDGRAAYMDDAGNEVEDERYSMMLDILSIRQ